MLFRVRYSVYRVEAPSAFEAKKKLIAMLNKNLDNLVSVEPAFESKPLWRLLLWGR